MRVDLRDLRTLTRVARQADAVLPRSIKALMDAVGERILVPEIERRQRSLIKKSAGNGLVESLRARSTQTQGRVISGYKNKVEHAGWWEFGGHTNSPRGNTFRERVKEGRTFYPALRAKRGEINEAMESVLDLVARVIEGTNRGA